MGIISPIGYFKSPISDFLSKQILGIFFAESESLNPQLGILSPTPIPTSTGYLIFPNWDIMTNLGFFPVSCL